MSLPVFVRLINQDQNVCSFVLCFMFIFRLQQRLKDGVVMDRLSTQIQTASGATFYQLLQLAGPHLILLVSGLGSIKLIEEELNLKFRGLEAAREGQLEARERLISEMESSARLRAEAAEAESYRLKGLLMHMETVLGTLRSQGAEEKERLRQEHQRLEAMQMALEADRVALHKRSSDEMAVVKQRQKEVRFCFVCMCFI